MSISIFLSFILGAAIVSIVSTYFYSKRQRDVESERRQRDEDVRKEMTSLRKEAEGLKQELRSSSAALHESERQVQYLTQTLSDPPQVFLNHLKKSQEHCEQLGSGLATAVGRAKLEIESLLQKQRILNRDSDPPLSVEEIVTLLRQESLTLGRHAQQLSEKRTRIEQLRKEVDGFHFENSESANQYTSTLNDITALIDRLCAPLTGNELVTRWIEKDYQKPHLTFDSQRAYEERLRAEAKDPKRPFEKWRDRPLTALEKFNQIRKSFGQRDGFG